MRIRGSFVVLWVFGEYTQAQPGAPDFDRAISWSPAIPNIGPDQEQIWSSPFPTHSKRTWIGASLVIGLAAGMVALNAHVARYFRNTSQFIEFNEGCAANVTRMGILAVLIALCPGGAISKDSNLRNTALLAGEAIAGSAILETVLESFDRRVRPMNVPPNRAYWEGWFDSRGSITAASSGFPSGHAVTAVVTVVSRRYGNHPWVAPMAYGVAGMIDFSRLALSVPQYLSDVFIGSALGYSVGRFVVLRQ